MSQTVTYQDLERVAAFLKAINEHRLFVDITLTAPTVCTGTGTHVGTLATEPDSGVVVIRIATD